MPVLTILVRKKYFQTKCIDVKSGKEYDASTKIESSKTAREGREKNMKNKTNSISKQAAKVAMNVLDKVLKTEANSASCLLVYQPKTPAELKRFKKSK